MAQSVPRTKPNTVEMADNCKVSQMPRANSGQYGSNAEKSK